MNMNLQSLDVDVLQRLYSAREKELEAAVLRGSSWDEVGIQRKALTELSCILHNKLERQGSHLKFPTRSEDENI